MLEPISMDFVIALRHKSDECATRGAALCHHKANRATKQARFFVATRRDNGNLGALRCCGQLVWNNQTSLRAPSTASQIAVVAFMKSIEIGSMSSRNAYFSR
jgi:hypothetical protein